jgi:hypothetical protein
MGSRLLRGGSTTLVGAVGALLAASAVGFANTQTVDDPKNDRNQGYTDTCEIVKATAGHAPGNRLKHTVTVAEPPPRASHAIVFVGDRKARGDAILSPGRFHAFDYATRFKNGGRTVVYTVTEAELREELEMPPNTDRYFWQANTCTGGDDAPNKRRGKAHSL